MNNERKPLLSAGDAMHGLMQALDVRDFYEDLITEGKLRVVEHASPVHKLSGLLCSICGISWQDDQYCRGCGNKIKR
jgi:hypothetical protein